MVFGFISFLLSWRRNVYLVRRKYDRVRERADRERNIQRRMTALKILDNIEPTLIILEEQRVSRFDRGRLLASVKAEVSRAKEVLKKDYVIQQPVYETRRPVRSYR